MKIQVTSIPVRDQDEALTFYTEKLGFVKKKDISLGNGNRRLTVVFEDYQDGTELLLEPSPSSFEPAKTYQKALFDAGIPCTQFNVTDIEKVFQWLKGNRVKFTKEPTYMGMAKIAIFDDYCGNLIQIVEPN